MRHLFDSEKSKKSIRLVKQLQELEDKAYEIEQRKKKQQELDDEAIARALQAELESQSSSSSSPPAATNTSPNISRVPVNYSPPPSRSNNGPPPLPVKPEAYNHSDTNPPTPRPLTPLYNMASSTTPSLPPRENRPKSYLPAYKSGVNVSIASPQVKPAHTQTPVMSPAAPNRLMNMPEPEPKYPQRKETPVQHKIPESVPPYNSSSFSTSSTATTTTTTTTNNHATVATPKPVTNNTNPFYNIPGSTVSKESRPSESAPSIMFDQQYPAMQPMSAPNYNTAASHSAPSLSHDKPLNEQHRPVMSATPVSFDSKYNQEPKKQGPVTEPFHIVSNNASSSYVENQGYPPPMTSQPPFTSAQWQNQQHYYHQNASSASLMESYQTPRPKRSSFVEASVAPQQQQYHHQNASSAALSEGYSTSRPKRPSFVESSIHQQQQRPPLSVYQNASSSTHLSSTTNFQNVANSIPTNPQSSLKTAAAASTPFHKPPSAEKTAATTSYENNSSSSLPSNNNNNTSTNTSSTTKNTTVKSHVKSTSQSSIPPKPTRPLPPAQPLTSTTSLPPVETQVRPTSQKSAFSDSVLSLKPDEGDTRKKDDGGGEDEDEWDIVSPTQKAAESDNESEYDYSDMIYDRRNEMTNNDPFADSFAVSAGRTPKATPPGSPKFKEVPKTPKAKTIVIDPTIMSTSRQDKVLDGEERSYVEKESQEIEIATYQTPKINHAYQTPKIDPMMYQTPYQTPKMDHYQDTPQIDPALYQTPDPAVYQTPLQPNISQANLGQGFTEDEVQQFYPTNILKAGAPPVHSYASEVSADDYGYYQEDSKNKSLPKLPEKSNKEDRHITVSSVNPGQRVWIRVHPTDTGKELAERIHIVASYKTQRVIKITTASGRSVPLDNSPVFEDWNEIAAFKEGESWKVDWGMMNPSYIDIISEGKEFMKQLKANFKSS